MTLDFNNIAEEIISNFKGGEKDYAAKMMFDGKVRIMKGRLIPGASIGLHTHTTNCEVIFMLKGEATLLHEGETSVLREGRCHYCPKGESHSIKNNGEVDVEFYAVVAEQ